jgi:hypothetical protein
MDKRFMQAVLRTWLTLNDFIVSATESECSKLLQFELNHQNRLRMVMRIHSRGNKVRAHRERQLYKEKINVKSNTVSK